MNHKSNLQASLTLLILLMAGTLQASQALSYRIIQKVPHDLNCFTQGLKFHKERLIESCGLYKKSYLTSWSPETGNRDGDPIHHLERRFFAEGLTLWNSTILLLTYRENTVLEYDLGLKEKKQHTLTGMHWGLTHNQEHLIKSDGSHLLTFLNRENFQHISYLPVTYDGEPLRGLNELEYIDGVIAANVIGSKQIVLIHETSGKVQGHLNLEPLYQTARNKNPNLGVLNGIAWHPKKRTLWVTGKNWPLIYELRVPALKSPARMLRPEL